MAIAVPSGAVPRRTCCCRKPPAIEFAPDGRRSGGRPACGRASRGRPACRRRPWCRRRSWTTPRSRRRRCSGGRRGRPSSMAPNMRSARSRTSASVVSAVLMGVIVARIWSHPPIGSEMASGNGRPLRTGARREESGGSDGCDGVRRDRGGAGRGGPAPGLQRLAGDHPGPREPLRRGHRRPPVDPRRSGAGQGRPLRRADRPRLPDGVALEPLPAPDRRRPGDLGGRQLRREQDPLPVTGPGGRPRPRRRRAAPRSRR